MVISNRKHLHLIWIKNNGAFPKIQQIAPNKSHIFSDVPEVKHTARSSQASAGHFCCLHGGHNGFPLGSPSDLKLSVDPGTSPLHLLLVLRGFCMLITSVQSSQGTWTPAGPPALQWRVSITSGLKQVVWMWVGTWDVSPGQLMSPGVGKGPKSILYSAQLWFDTFCCSLLICVYVSVDLWALLASMWVTSRRSSWLDVLMLDCRGAYSI